MRSALVLAGSLVASSALACPACASANRAVSPLQLVLVLLPFVVFGIAARAIYVVIARDRD